MSGMIAKWNKLSDRERLIVSIAFIIAGIYVFVSYVFDPLYEKYESNQKTLSERQLLMKKYERMLADTDKAVANLRKLKSIELGVNQVLLSSPTSDLASAEMQGIVKKLAEQMEISFTRITPSKLDMENGFTEISLKLPFKGNIKQVQELLYLLETADQFFHIKSFTVRTQRRKKSSLRVELDVAAYIRTEVQPDEESDEVEIS